ncbi:MAG: SDR family oxidoreductase [Phycisphaerae bacterium]
MASQQSNKQKSSGGRGSREEQPLGQSEPKPPFPKQHQKSPGLESKIEPRPRYEGSKYKAAGKLEGKRALITGGDSGIGRAVAVFYAKEGADVAINYLPEEQSDAEETEQAVAKEGRRCVLIPGDITNEQFCKDLVERAIQELGGLDILVSNAAHQAAKQSVEEVTTEEWDKTFKTNIYAYFWLTKAAIPHLKPGSVILATTSENSFDPSQQLPDYATTKFAINGYTKVLAQQLQKKGIRVNAVAPGPVWTPLNPSDPGRTPEKVAEFGQKNPMGRPAQPEELAPAYVFLASDADSSYINGVVLPVMGGEIVQGG